jgi:hypothetical protein
VVRRFKDSGISAILQWGLTVYFTQTGRGLVLVSDENGKNSGENWDCEF